MSPLGTARTSPPYHFLSVSIYPRLPLLLLQPLLPSGFPPALMRVHLLPLQSVLSDVPGQSGWSLRILLHGLRLREVSKRARQSTDRVFCSSVVVTGLGTTLGEL